jgi:hypothetical protein
VRRGGESWRKSCCIRCSIYEFTLSHLLASLLEIHQLRKHNRKRSAKERCQISGLPRSPTVCLLISAQPPRDHQIDGALSLLLARREKRDLRATKRSYYIGTRLCPWSAMRCVSRMPQGTAYKRDVPGIPHARPELRIPGVY